MLKATQKKTQPTPTNLCSHLHQLVSPTTKFSRPFLGVKFSPSKKKQKTNLTKNQVRELLRRLRSIEIILVHLKLTAPQKKKNNPTNGVELTQKTFPLKPLLRSSLNCLSPATYWRSSPESTLMFLKGSLGWHAVSRKRRPWRCVEPWRNGTANLFVYFSGSGNRWLGIIELP